MNQYLTKTSGTEKHSLLMLYYYYYFCKYKKIIIIITQNCYSIFFAAECVPGRSDVQCLHRWQQVLHPDLVKGPWSKEVWIRVILVLFLSKGPVFRFVFFDSDNFYLGFPGRWSYLWAGSKAGEKEMVWDIKILARPDRQAM